MSLTDKIYHDLLKDIKENGSKKWDRTNTGTTSVFGRQIRFNMNDGFPMLTTKRLHLRSIIHELIWFLNGDTNVDYLNENGVTIWDEWADSEGRLGPIYGKQWVKWNSHAFNKDAKLDSKTGNWVINQIQKAIDDLKNNPDSRRIIVNAWNVGELNDMALPPCHYSFQFFSNEMGLEERNREYCRINDKIYSTLTSTLSHEKLDKLDFPRRKLSLMWNQRSVDTFLGLPFNIASYALLLNMFAQQVNMLPDELIGNLGDTHIYSNHLEYVEKQLERSVTKYKNPKLKLTKAKDIFSYSFEDFEILDYECFPNWKNVPIAI